MTAERIADRERACRKLERGANLLARAVKQTLGPKGRTVLRQSNSGDLASVRDGAAVTRELELDDQFENLVVQLVREVAARTNNELARNGTTTATVLALAMLQEGLSLVTVGANPRLLKIGIDKAVAVVVEGIGRLARPVLTKQRVAQVAALAAHDREIGALLSQAFTRVGESGIVMIEESCGTETTLGFVEGFQFEQGYISPNFVNDPGTMSVSFNRPNILLVDGAITRASELLPILQTAGDTKRPLVIIADTVKGEALTTLMLKRLRGTLQCVAIKAPGCGERRRQALGDLAVLTGAQVMTVESGRLFDDRVGVDVLGSARKVVATSDKTLVMSGRGRKAEIDDQTDSLEAEMKRSDAESDRSWIRERLGRLRGNVGVLRVGARSYTAFKEKQQRVQDALVAIRAAVAEGIVPGGGTAYVNLLPLLQDLKLEGDEKLGVGIVAKALQAPLRVIADNSGAVGAVIVENVKTFDEGVGFDVVVGDYVSMKAAGIVDPAKVLRVALQNAASITSLILTTETVTG